MIRNPVGPGPAKPDLPSTARTPPARHSALRNPAAWAALLSFVSAEAEAQSQSCALEVRGQVVDADLGTPVPDAVVVSAEVTATARTDAAGDFTLAGVCPGPLTLTVSKSGFAPARVELEAPETRPVVVRLPFAMQSVTITAPPADPLADLGFTDRLDGAGLADARGLSLGDALSRTEGVQVLRSGAVNKPVIDGFYGNRILILNDGLRHHAQLWALDHAPEIDPFSAGALTVVRGAEGVRYGADAIGGVILIEPVPFRDPSQPGLEGEANLVGISNGRQGIANLSLVGTVPGLPRLSVRAQGSFKKAGSLDAPDYPLDNTAAQEGGGSVALRYQGEGWQASMGASVLDTEYGIYTGVRAGSPRDFRDAIAREVPNNVELFEFSYEIDRSFSKVSHTYVRGDVRLDVGDWGTLGLRYGYQENDRREFENVRGDPVGPQLAFVLDSHALELTLDHRIAEDIVGVVGVAGLLQHNDHIGLRLIPDYDRRMGGVFAIERYQGEQVQVAMGLRYERQGMDTEQPARRGANVNPPERFSLSFEALMATLGASFEPDPAWRFDVHVASATRIPTIDELFLDGLLPGEIYIVEGDRNLSPERTLNLGLGIAFAHRWLDAKATGYVHRIADYIYRAPVIRDGEPFFRPTRVGLTPALEYRNVDALYAGGTVSVALHPWSFVELESRASYVRARDLTNDTFLVNIPPDRYQNRLTLLAPRWGPLLESSAWFESVVVMRQREIDPNAELAPPPASYHLLNAGAAITFSIGPQEVRANVDLQNLLDVSYRDYLSRLRFFGDEPGFTATLRLSTPFEVSYGANGTASSPEHDQ